jgi:phosphotransferase system enzyme I (PtsI)
MKTLSGIPTSSGIAIGKAFLYVESDFPEIPRYTIQKSRVELEIKRFHDAVKRSALEMKRLKDKAEKEMSKNQAGIFTAHLMMLEDPVLQEEIINSIKKEMMNTEWAVWNLAHSLMQTMSSSPDPVFRERVIDITEVSKRLLDDLLSVAKVSLSNIDEEVILVAHNLLPSDILTINKTFVKGIVMDMGGGTSHTAILARAFNIPSVLGLSTATREIAQGDILALDGSAGEVIINPEKAVLNKYQKNARARSKRQDKELELKSLPAKTLDGRRVTLKANIEIPEEAEQVLKAGAEGIGLYRSEFLFLTPGKAAEEEYQYEAYSSVLKAMGNLPVTIRTVDIGGDKVLPDYYSSSEKNPLLGWRAIRFSLSRPDLLKTQLRAILRASPLGNVRVMFPLISGVEELEQALALLEEAKAECLSKGLAIAPDVEAGIMIEVPSAAVIADLLAEKSGFFSIGTNDLIQYTLAVDRGNEKVNYLAQPYHPGVLRLIKTSIDAAHRKKIKAAMCGEMAGDLRCTALLLGLGLDEFSMSASSIPGVKQIIRSVKMEDCKALAKKAVNGVSSKANAVLIKSWMADHVPSFSSPD